MSRNPLYFWLWLLYKKECRKYYNDLDLSRITDHEKFRKPLNLYYPIKGKTTLIDKDGKSNSRLHSNSWYTRYLFRNSGQLTCSLEINENRFILTFQNRSSISKSKLDFEIGASFRNRSTILKSKHDFQIVAPFQNQSSILKSKLHFKIDCNSKHSFMNLP